MTHDIRDEAFERALRGTLAGLEPGEVPAGLRASVAAVPRVARRERPAPRLLFALGGLAAVLVVGVLAIATLTRLPGPTPPIGTEATPTAAPSAPSSLRFELVTDDVFAPTADILDILDARLAAAGYDDAATSVAEGRFLVDVEAEPSEGPRILELLTAPGRVEALATGLDEVVVGEPLAPDAYSVLFHGDEVTSAELVEDPGMPASLQLTLDEAATARFAEYTGAHVGESFTIAVDGVPATVPAINEPILGGELLISFGDIGVPATAEARDLAAFLVSGQLPTALRLATETPRPSAAAEATPSQALPPTPSASASPTAGQADLAALRFDCGRFPFPADVLDERRSDELADTPEAAALRAHLLREGPDFDWVPDAGWTLLGTDAIGAEYLARSDDGTLAWIELTREGSWQVSGWGSCTPRLVRDDGIGSAEWVLAPGQDIGPDTTTFEALVTELACASGRPADRRIVGPDIIATEDAVLVIFGVRPRAGGQDCPSNPASQVTVTLPEPLGDRRLLDGSTAPPREPVPDP